MITNSFRSLFDHFAKLTSVSLFFVWVSRGSGKLQVISGTCRKGTNGLQQCPVPCFGDFPLLWQQEMAINCRRLLQATWTVERLLVMCPSEVCTSYLCQSMTCRRPYCSPGSRQEPQASCYPRLTHFYQGQKKHINFSNIFKNLLMPLFLMGCFPGNFQEGKRPIKAFRETAH